MEKSSDANEEKRDESQSGPGDGPLYFQLEKANNKEVEIGANVSSEAYDWLDHTAKHEDYRQNGDEGAYKHIELQPTQVDKDQEYQHLNRSGFH